VFRKQSSEWVWDPDHLTWRHIEDDGMPQEQKQELDRSPESDNHYYHPLGLRAFEVGHGELKPESMVGLGTWTDHRLVSRPVVNTGHKNRGGSLVA